MRKNKKKFLYIISPNKIEKNFYHYLRKILKLNTTSIFQLRLKSYSHKTKINIGHKVKKICRIYKVKLIINDDVILAKELGADGCHLGQSDWHPTKARKILGNLKNQFIIGYSFGGVAVLETARSREEMTGLSVFILL